MLEVKPDIEFKKQLRKISRAPLNECMQCGTCSVVCSLSPDESPFPRKEMIWASWGLKEQLMANTDVWLCHQCGDCSTYCPRGVKPADVIAAVRQMTYLQYARPHFLGVLMSRPEWLPVALLIPVVLISCILLLAGTFTIPAGTVNYSLFFPHAWLNGSFTLITLTAYGFAFAGLLRFHNDLKSRYSVSKRTRSLRASFIAIIKNKILTHSGFSSCTKNHSRKWAHLLVFYGFILLLLVTAYAIVAAIIHRYPLTIVNPFKILGNFAALMLTAGLCMMIINRLSDRKNTNSNYSDWLLLISMLLLTISGVLVEAARFLNWSTAYHLYFFHLVAVWFVIIYLPYTKFGHLLYRSVALSFADSVSRK